MKSQDEIDSFFTNKVVKLENTEMADECVEILERNNQIIDHNLRIIICEETYLYLIGSWGVASKFEDDIEISFEEFKNYFDE